MTIVFCRIFFWVFLLSPLKHLLLASLLLSEPGHGAIWTMVWFYMAISMLGLDISGWFLPSYVVPTYNFALSSFRYCFVLKVTEEKQLNHMPPIFTEQILLTAGVCEVGVWFFFGGGARFQEFSCLFVGRDLESFFLFKIIPLHIKDECKFPLF